MGWRQNEKLNSGESKNKFFWGALASLVDQMIKRLPAMLETQVRSLGQGEPLEKAMAPHSSTLAWEIPWTEEPGRLQSIGLQRVRHDWVTTLQAAKKRLPEQWLGRM